MQTALIISGVILLWYCSKELDKQANGQKPNWNKALIATMLWPLPQLSRWLSGKRTSN